MINPRIIEFLSLFISLSGIIKCESRDSNITFGQSNIGGLGFDLAANCKNCEPRCISKKSK